MTLKHVCHKHLHAFINHFDLQMQKLILNELKTHLKACWNHRDDLNVFKISSDHMSWFWLKFRSQIENDLHDVYAKRSMRKSIVYQSSVHQVKIIINEIEKSEIWVNWQKNKNLLVQKMFLWLWDEITSDEQHVKSIDDMIIKEFNMYLHHQRQRNDQSNKKWLHIMFYFLS